MKKNFKYYIAIWVVLIAIYNVVVFTVEALPGYEINYDARFWISWRFILAAFVGQLICAYTSFKPKNNEKLFLSIPLITQSYSGAIAMTIIGSVCMLIPDFPYWIATVVCVLVFAFSAIGVIKAKAAAKIVSDVSAKVKAQTFFIKALTVDAETLMVRAKNDEIKAECKRVYEAVRYSDPMSNDALASIEGQITVAFSKLSQAVAEDNTATVKELSNELIILVSDRNIEIKSVSC